MGGAPCIRGMRITVATVIGCVTDGASPSEVVAAYPDLEVEDVHAALATVGLAYVGTTQERKPPMLVPLNKNVLVQQDAAEEKTAGGLFIPEVAKQKGSGAGVVVALSRAAAKEMEFEGVTVGSRVTFPKYAGTRVAGTEDMLMLEASEILAVEDGKSGKTTTRIDPATGQQVTETGFARIAPPHPDLKG